MKRSFLDIIAASADALNYALKPRILWAGLLAVAFLISAGVSLTLPHRRPAVIWFPDSRSEDGSKSKAELRYIQRGSDKAGDARAIIEEILLGPMNTSACPIAVPDANVRSVIISGKTAYVDLSSDILFGRVNAGGVYGAPPVAPRVAMRYIERSLRWNFPSMSIIMTVDGLEPSWQALETAPKGKKK